MIFFGTEQFMGQRTAIIIGAGPAGLTAAYQLLEETDIKPIVLEMSGDIGGLSKTINYNGNRIDMGGHRFFSKSQRVMDFWLNIMPLQSKPAKDYAKTARIVKLSEDLNATDPEKTDRVMLARLRLSRIFFSKKFFDYPISLSYSTISNLGFSRTIRIALSYAKSCILPIKNERNLEDFLINRFGKELYLIFFKDYTEKIWGMSCDNIAADWGRQRIKGLSLRKSIGQAIKNLLSSGNPIYQEQGETSLISQFLYPKLGPGQLWQEVANIIKNKGGCVFVHKKVVALKRQGNRITKVIVVDQRTKEQTIHKADYFFSSMPVKELIAALNDDIPENLRDIANGLIYRDLITVGLLLKKLKIKNETKISTINNIIPDNWIYIQEKKVMLARLQIFNNWSPYMVRDDNLVWIGLEYICSLADPLRQKSDEQITEFAIDELAKMDIAEKRDVLDSVVVHMPKAYPAYFGTYSQFDKIRDYLDPIENLFLIGRNGMHRYNNQDHSMLSAMTAVENIKNGVLSKDNVWAVNTENEYHEYNRGRILI